MAKTHETLKSCDNAAKIVENHLLHFTNSCQLKSISFLNTIQNVSKVKDQCQVILSHLSKRQVAIFVTFNERLSHIPLFSCSSLWSRRVGSSAVTVINERGGGGTSSCSAARTEIGHRQHPVKSDFLSSPPLYRRRASCLQLWALLSSEPLSVAFGCPPAVCLASDLVKPQLVYR